MRISDSSLYSTDNGRVLCGQHLGSSAKRTGRDISGQAILPLGPEEVRYMQSTFDETPSCERCGKQASRLILTGV